MPHHPLIATLWYPSLNPVGPQSVAALVVLTLAAWITHRASGSPPNAGGIALFLLPAVLLAATAVTEGSLLFYLWYRGRSLPDAEDFATVHLLLAFGFGFALQNYRMRTPIFRLNAVVFTGAFGALIVVEFVATLALFMAWRLDAPLLLAPLALYLTAWAAANVAGYTRTTHRDRPASRAR